MYPRFKTENIAQIESSFGGLLYILSSFFYLALIVGIEVIPLRNYIQYGVFLKGRTSFSYFLPYIVILLLVSFFVFIVPLKMGQKRLAQYEDY